MAEESSGVAMKTICMTLNQVLTQSAKLNHLPKLKEFVHIGTRLAHELCVFVNALVLFATQNNLYVPDMHQTVIDHCAAVVVTGVWKRSATVNKDQRVAKSDETLRAFVHHWVPSGFDYSAFRVVVTQQIRVDVLTNFKNALFMPFFGRQAKVLKWQLFNPNVVATSIQWLRANELPNDYKTRGQLLSHLQHAINNPAFTPARPGDDLYARLIAEHRAHRLFALGGFSDAMMETFQMLTGAHSSEVLEYYGYLLREVEKAQASGLGEQCRIPRTFSVLPLRAYKTAHLRLSETVMHTILGPKVQWADIIKTKWLKRGFHSMSTDGVNGNIQVKLESKPQAAIATASADAPDQRTKPKRRCAPKRKTAPKSKKPISLTSVTRGLFEEANIAACDIGTTPIVGVDPGRTSPIAASNGYCLGKGRYYEESGMQHAQRRWRRHEKGLGVQYSTTLADMTRLSLKTGNFATFMERWTALVPRQDYLFSVYSWNGLKRAKLYVHGRKQCLVAKVTQELTKGAPDAIIAFGAGQFSTSGSGSRAGPKAQIIKHLAKTHRVVMIDEFRTSQKCSACFTQLDVPTVRHTARLTGVVEEKEVFGIRQCPHCTEGQHPFCLNRDFNAARNMSKLLSARLRGEGRLGPFCRVDTSTRLEEPPAAPPTQQMGIIYQKQSKKRRV